MNKNFHFDLHRINIVDESNLFSSRKLKPIRSNSEITELVKNSCSPEFDIEQKTHKSKFMWSLRDFKDYTAIFKERRIISVIISRSVISKNSLIVTDNGIINGTSASTPPPANTAVIFFDLDRHLAAIEHNGELHQTSWRDFIEKIFSKSAAAIEKTSSTSLTPVPEKNEIIKTFKSFEVLTRLKVTLRIPNPELNRYTKSLYEDLKQSNIREYMQDMKNPQGLSKDENSRPYASAAIAEQGYRDGEAQLEGIRNGKYEKVSSGTDAAKGSTKSLRDFVRGIQATAKSKETQKVLSEIMNEIDRIHPLESASETPNP